MTFLAIGLNSNKEYAIARYKSDLVKQINLIYPSTSLNWQQDGHHVRVKRTKVLPEPIRIIQTNDVQIKTANPLENRIVELEKQYGTIDKVPAGKLMDLQTFAKKYAKESKATGSNMNSIFHSVRYQQYLSEKLTKMHPEKLAISKITDKLNADHFITFDGQRLLTDQSVRNLLRYRGLTWAHQGKGRRKYAKS